MIEQTLFPVKEYPAYHEAGTWAKSDENENLNNHQKVLCYQNYNHLLLLYIKKKILKSLIPCVW